MSGSESYTEMVNRMDDEEALRFDLNQTLLPMTSLDRDNRAEIIVRVMPIVREALEAQGYHDALIAVAATNRLGDDLAASQASLAAALDRLVQVRALADEWDEHATNFFSLAHASARLRAILDPADTKETQ